MCAKLDYNLIDAQNKEFIERVNELLHSCENGSDWLHHHIKGFDCSVATFMRMRSLPNLL